jgi:hypothetical protein
VESPPEVEDAFFKLMRGDTPKPTDDDAVVCVLDDFITWCRENRASRTTARSKDFIQDFVKADDGGLKFGTIPVTRLTGKHVTAWLRQRPTWGNTTKKNAITALQRGFNWACKNRGLERNPIRGGGRADAPFTFTVFRCRCSSRAFSVIRIVPRLRPCRSCSISPAATRPRTRLGDTCSSSAA